MGDGAIAVADCTRLCNQYNFEGVVIVGFDRDGNKIETASDGRNTAFCEAAARVARDIGERLWRGAGTDGLVCRGETPRGIMDVLAERESQRRAWGDSHDDDHDGMEIAQAAAAYALHAIPNKGAFYFGWPGGWSEDQFKPRSHRENCVRAAAMLIAEVERIDREDAKEPTDD